MRSLLYRGLFFGVSVFVVAALLWSVARAEVLQGVVRITGDQMQLRIVDQEPGRVSAIWLNALVFELSSRDTASFQGSRLIETERGQVAEQVTVMLDSSFVSEFKVDPKGTAMRLGMVNYSEAQCPADGNALLLWTRSRGPLLQNFGNCFQLK